ncbi:hypothetical protein CPB85DRAFT_1257024 [Mucidula mucida]|nr:hypothetical protein CPB85DRAFT_1257024 [Mucidula mucida]
MSKNGMDGPSKAAGKVQCPNCKEYINVGAAGITALEKVHCGTDVCKKNKQKNEANRGQTSLLGMFAKKPATARTKPASYTTGPNPTDTCTTIYTSNLIRAVIITCFPAAISEADMDNELAGFGGNPPGGIIVKDLAEAWKIWDPPSNCLLQRDESELKKQ